MTTPISATGSTISAALLWCSAKGSIAGWTASPARASSAGSATFFTGRGATRDFPGPHDAGSQRAWTVDGPSGAIPISTFDQDHGGLRSLGYRFGNVAYSSDVVGLPEESFAALQNLDVWIVDALRYAPHPTHAHVDRALNWIERVRPRRAILTNMHLDLDYATLSESLPAGVEAAYDGLCFQVPLDCVTS